ncbi:MAG: hypothetical protein M3257_01845 [Actinomycetota bacterium]|nr:hypothetical protein [Actinomycetota bacterium]
MRSFRLQEADALDAVQMTWLRLAENAHRVQFPEKLGGWLATTARRECLRIQRQAKSASDLTNMTPELSPTLRRVPSSGSSTPTPRGRCGPSWLSGRLAGRPCGERCSPAGPAPTPRSPARSEHAP